MKAALTRPLTNPSAAFNHSQSWAQQNKLSMLRSEVEMLLEEDTRLMKVAGAAALFVSQLQGAALPQGALDAASTLATLVSGIPDDIMCEALDMLNH